MKDLVWKSGLTSRGIFFKTWGDFEAPTAQSVLVLIMGYSGNCESWSIDFLQSLMKDFRLVLLDNRGTGQSVSPDGPETYTISEMATDTLSVLDALKLNQAHLLGYSLGGVIALELARRHRSRVETLIVMSSTAGGRNYVGPRPEIWEQISRPTGATVLEKTECIWRACVPESRYQELLPDLLETFERSSKWLTRGRVLAYQLMAYKSFFIDKDGLDVGMPILIVHGKEDRLTPSQNSINLSKLLPQARLEIVEDCEHMPFLEQRQCVLKILNEFLG